MYWGYVFKSVWGLCVLLGCLNWQHTQSEQQGARPAAAGTVSWAKSCPLPSFVKKVNCNTAMLIH